MFTICSESNFIDLIKKIRKYTYHDCLNQQCSVLIAFIMIIAFQH